MSARNQSTGSHPAEKFIKTIDAPLAVIRHCTLCKFSNVRRKVRGANGFRDGNKQRGVLIQHIKAEHAIHLIKGE